MSWKHSVYPTPSPPPLGASALKVHFIHIENEVISELRPIVLLAQGKAQQGARLSQTRQHRLHGAASPSISLCSSVPLMNCIHNKTVFSIWNILPVGNVLCINYIELYSLRSNFVPCLLCFSKCFQRFQLWYLGQTFPRCVVDLSSWSNMLRSGLWPKGCELSSWKICCWQPGCSNSWKCVCFSP